MKPHPFTIAADAVTPPQGFSLATRRTFTAAQFLQIFPGRKPPRKTPELYDFPGEALPAVHVGKLPTLPGNPARYFANYYKPTNPTK